MARIDQPNHEYEYQGALINGFLMLFINFIVIPLLVLATFTFLQGVPALMIPIFAILAIAFVIGCVGFFTQEPNEARVMIFFGKYVGTLRGEGFYYVNPFCTGVNMWAHARRWAITGPTPSCRARSCRYASATWTSTPSR